MGRNGKGMLASMLLGLWAHKSSPRDGNAWEMTEAADTFGRSMMGASPRRHSVAERPPSNAMERLRDLPGENRVEDSVRASLHVTPSPH
jgi:hypothetical protein